MYKNMYVMCVSHTSKYLNASMKALQVGGFIGGVGAWGEGVCGGVWGVSGLGWGWGGWG